MGTFKDLQQKLANNDFNIDSSSTVLVGISNECNLLIQRYGNSQTHTTGVNIYKYTQYAYKRVQKEQCYGDNKNNSTILPNQLN
jgi:hypothetical protein